MYKAENAMALHIQDPEADRVLRDFAQRRNVGLTAAIKLAVSEADQFRDERSRSLSERLEPIWAKVRAAKSGKPFDWQEDKRFMDEMWGEEP
ncbi:MAG: type II toxin-antitoxin system VapB family antitoxin [Rhizobiaceae bacterium]